MNLKPITPNDLPLVDTFLKMDHHQRGYPTGDLEILQHDFEEEELSLTDSIHFIEKNDQIIGLIGTFGASWGNYVIGPIFEELHHHKDNIKEAIGLLGDTKFIVDVPSTNRELKTALEELQVPVDSESTAMHYHVNTHNLTETANIVPLTDDLKPAVNELFIKNLRPWAWNDESVEDVGESDHTAILMLEGHVAGAITWDWSTETHEGELEYLCVGSDYQGKGYGKELVDYALNRIKPLLVEGENDEFFLDVAKANTAARNFYERYGFIVDYERSIYIAK